MLTDLDSLARQALTGDGRGGKRPGTGRPRKDGTKAAPEHGPVEFEIKTTDQLLNDGPPAPLEIPPADDETDNHASDMGAINFKVPENPGALYAGAKARKEAALAAKAELDFRVKAGLYLPREAVRSALATAYQAVSQALRSIPDNLERKLGISPEIAEAVGISIDEAMGELSLAMEETHMENDGLLAKD